MNMSIRRGSFRTALFPIVVTLACSIANLHWASPSIGAESLAFSFETGLEGFQPNGGGTSVSLDTIGATDGTNSLKFTMVGAASFSGALTTSINPTLPGGSTIIGDPPGIDYILFDLTLPEEFPLPPAVGFLRASVTVFGNSQPDYPGGQQTGLSVQFFDNEIDVAGPAGTYHDLRIDLTSAAHPLTFETGSFNDIIGTVGSGLNDIIPSSFQIYFNKNSGSEFPLTLYMDNIRVGILPPAIAGDYNLDGAVDAADYVVWRKNDGSENPLPNDNELGVPIRADHYDLWRANFGLLPEVGGGNAIAAPEPANLLLLVVGCVCWWGTKRIRASTR
jgi:hypothetical protein